MPWTNNSSIQALRLQYNAALTAHETSRQMLIDAKADGATPASELIDAEAKAKAALERVRAKLLDAITKAIMGSAEPDPPAQP